MLNTFKILKGIKERLDKYPSYILRNLKKEFRGELEEVLSQEASLWHQKARCKWMCEGDCNMKFFHVSTIARKRVNMITMLKLRDNSWCDDPEVLQHMTIDFYESLFTKDRLLINGSLKRSLFYKMTNDDIKTLKAIIMNEEIKKVVFYIDPLKPSSIDGIHAIFYQKKWKVVRQSVCDFVTNIWNGGSFESWLNHTY